MPKREISVARELLPIRLVSFIIGHELVNRDTQVHRDGSWSPDARRLMRWRVMLSGWRGD